MELTSFISIFVNSELGIRIRSNADFAHTMIATNSNGGCGYVPTSDTWEIEGGYELPIANKSGFDKNTLNREGIFFSVNGNNPPPFSYIL